ncbi:MAG TPA: ABC transporter ATP-binding protein [Xanthobacteraceae bacterium]|nr:ABC transporter ATP-binding protein [Xanthobacteraceae bacterium]
MTDAVLEVTGLSRSFAGLKAVDGVSFKVMPNRITTVIGPNGAGKSTLFNLISGVLRPDAGDVFVQGKRMTGLNPASLNRQGVARSFQITNLFFDLSVRENIRLAAQAREPAGKMLRSVKKSTLAHEQSDQMLARFDLTAKAGELAGNLSHGEQRRLEIAVCLASNPTILLLDEPTQGMSHGDTLQTAEMLKQLAKQVTILLIEHDIGLVMSLSDHVVVMHQGRKLMEGTPEAVRADSSVQAAYFGHV